MGGAVGVSLIAAAVGSQVLSAGVAARGAEEQRAAIRRRQTQERLAAEQQSLGRLDSLQNVLAAQQAAIATRGIGAGGGSFRAIQRNTFNAFNQDEKASALNLSFRQAALRDQLEASKLNEFAQILGNVGNVAKIAGVATGPTNVVKIPGVATGPTGL